MNSNFFGHKSFNERRRDLVESLRIKGIKDENVLKAIGELPREKFLNSPFENRAYEDTALPIDCGQTISQPYTVAYMTSLLNIKQNDKILEIGTGSGYQACILYLLGARVFTVERIIQLYEQANIRFKEFGYNIMTRLGDGSIGWSEFAPYNGIIVTAAAPKVPEALKNQLEIGSRLVIPIGTMHSQAMVVVERQSNQQFKQWTNDYFKFVPLIGKEGWEMNNNDYR